MKKMHADRLIKLADFLGGVPDEQFNINIWRREHNQHQHGECKTVACAAGWACSIPSFNQDGLRFSQAVGEVLFEPSVEEQRLIDGETGGNSDGSLYEGFYACEAFFGLTSDEAASVFSPDGYSRVETVTPKMVSQKIRELVASKT